MARVWCLARMGLLRVNVKCGMAKEKVLGRVDFHLMYKHKKTSGYADVFFMNV